MTVAVAELVIAVFAIACIAATAWSAKAMSPARAYFRREEA